MSIWELRIVIMGTNLRFKSFANAVELFSINFQIRSNSFLNITSPKLVDIKDIFCRILPKERAPLNEVHDSFDHSLSSYIIKKVMKWHKTPAYYNIYFFLFIITKYVNSEFSHVQWSPNFTDYFCQNLRFQKVCLNQWHLRCRARCICRIFRGFDNGVFFAKIMYAYQ